MIRKYRVLYRNGDKTEWSRLLTYEEAEGCLSLSAAVEIVEVKKQKPLPNIKSNIFDDLFGDIFKRKRS